jgi:Ser/Thr protein kinase RdoA (MazF antagonist)
MHTPPWHQLRAPPAPAQGLRIMAVVDVVPAPVLARYRAFAGGSSRRFGSGLINRTFLVEKDGQQAIAQQLHRIFGPAVNDDLDAVTTHLARKGLVTPRLLRTDDGTACVIDLPDGSDDPALRAVWRLITRVPGSSVDKLTAPAQAQAAGALVARFHAAVEDLQYDYRHVREGVHDTKRHLVKLARMMAKHRAHRLGREAGALGKEILDAGARLPDLLALPKRHSHGDLKISNLLFDENGAGVCLVDLDTLGRMPWPLEMGDALRSWCNPQGEDVTDAGIDVELFRAAVDGYFTSAKRPFLVPDESEALVDGLHTICVELASRFCADALDESYFGWDSARYPTRGDHNLVRARGQWSLARSVHSRRDELVRIVRGVA